MGVWDQWRAWRYDWDTKRHLPPDPRTYWAERGVTFTNREWGRIRRRRLWLKVRALRHLVCCGPCE